MDAMGLPQFESEIHFPNHHVWYVRGCKYKFQYIFGFKQSWLFSETILLIPAANEANVVIEHRLFPEQG